MIETEREYEDRLEERRQDERIREEQQWAARLEEELANERSKSI